MLKNLLFFYFLQILLAQHQLDVDYAIGYYWRNSISTAIALEFFFTLVLYTALLGFDIFKKRNILFQQTEIEETTQIKNPNDTFPQIQEGDYEPQQIQHQQPQEVESQTIIKTLKNKNLHDFAFYILISHALVIGFAVTGGYHGAGEAILAWIHFLFFIGFVGFNYMRPNNEFFKFTLLPFYLIDFISLVISLVKVN